MDSKDLILRNCPERTILSHYDENIKKMSSPKARNLPLITQYENDMKVVRAWGKQGGWSALHKTLSDEIKSGEPVYIFGARFKLCYNDNDQMKLGLSPSLI